MKIAIAGAGKLGLRTAEILMGAGHSITLIDKDEAHLETVSAGLNVATVAGNAKEVRLLEQIGIDSYDVFITSTDRDEKNIVIGSIAKRLGAKKLIARIRDPEHMNQYEFLEDAFKIDFVVNPDRSVAKEMAIYLVEKYSLGGGVMNAGKLSLVEFGVDKKKDLAGLSAATANGILADAGLRLVALSKNGKVVIPNDEDRAKIIIEEDDELYAVGEREQVEAAAKKLVEKEKYTDLRRMMIVGGGKAGFYLANTLQEFGVSVKIIDSDKERCQYLATHLKNALILHGDAADMQFLDDENLSQMDAFVATTGFDEENLLLALHAKRKGIEDVIAKVSREGFGKLIEDMGVDMALNPIDIEASHIARYIKGEETLLSQTIQGQAEVLYMEAVRGMFIVGKSLEALKLPDGITIAAIQRGSQLFYPDAETKVEDGDRLLVIGLLSESAEVERLFKNRHA